MTAHGLIDTTEMYLRTVFELEEEGIVPLRARIAERLSQSGPTVSQTVARMERDGLLRVEGDRQLALTESGRALGYVVAIHLAGEGFVFHPLSYRLGVDFGQRLARLDQRYGSDESGELVAGEEGFLHRRVAGDAGVFGVRHDRFRDHLGPAAFFQNFIALVWMVLEAGIFFIVEIVHKSHDAPKVFF